MFCKLQSWNFILTAWRNSRLTNGYFEQISTWDDMTQSNGDCTCSLQSRINFISLNKVRLHLSLCDGPWTVPVTIMARTAHQLGVPEVSVIPVKSKLIDCAMDAADAFSKSNEQILTSRNGSEDEQKGWLNLNNITTCL